jgi:hypothetical protein
VRRFDVAIQFESGFVFYYGVEGVDDLDALAEALNRVYDTRLTEGRLGAQVTRIKVRESRPPAGGEAPEGEQADVPVVVIESEG